VQPVSDAAASASAAITAHSRPLEVWRCRPMGPIVPDQALRVLSDAR
jgi:hypothetical protein